MFALVYRVADEGNVVQPADVVLVEGILAFYWPELRDQYDMMLFVDTDADTRLARRGEKQIVGISCARTIFTDI